MRLPYHLFPFDFLPASPPPPGRVEPPSPPQELSAGFLALVADLTRSFARAWTAYHPGVYFPDAGRFADPPPGGWPGAGPDFVDLLVRPGIRDACRGLFGAAASSVTALRARTEAAFPASACKTVTEPPATPGQAVDFPAGGGGRGGSLSRTPSVAREASSGSGMRHGSGPACAANSNVGGGRGGSNEERAAVIRGWFRSAAAEAEAEVCDEVVAGLCAMQARNSRRLSHARVRIAVSKSVLCLCAVFPKSI